MTHTDVATFLADKAVVQRVGFTIHTQLRCVLDLKIIPKAECWECCLKLKRKSSTIMFANI